MTRRDRREPAESGAPLDELLHDLSRPEAYPHAASDLRVVHTHVSAVFLAGEHVYKLKKPLDLGFLDYSTPARRRACCEAEVELNRRLASDVYLGVTPIVRGADGRLRVGAPGEERAALEVAVHMRRLPEERTLERLLAEGRAGPPEVRRLARRLAEFHAEAERGPEVSRWGRFEVVAGNCRENFQQVRPNVGRTLSARVLERLETRTEAALAAQRERIEARAARDVCRDTHGDLRLEHVYLLPDPSGGASEPDRLVVVDCIEFNERFRFADPIADVAFLSMDLRRTGRADLATLLEEEYALAAEDADGRALFPLYVAYRATIRGKVDGFTVSEEEVPEAEREAALQRARRQFLLALSTLTPARERPALVIVCGLPGAGKSYLAGRLAAGTDAVWIRSDVVRKELAGLPPERPAPAAALAQLYTSAASERTYAECLARAEAAWFEGRRAIVDATFVREDDRRRFVQAARRWGVPARLLLLEASDEVVLPRLAARQGDPSDADAQVRAALRARWEPASPELERLTDRVGADAAGEEVLAAAIAALARQGLA